MPARRDVDRSAAIEGHDQDPFGSLTEGCTGPHEQMRAVGRPGYGQDVFVAALRLERNYLIVVSNTRVEEALEIYRLGWGIEVLFAALTSRGFNFEETHLIDRERIKKLVVLLALAFTWAHLVGLWLAQSEPPTIRRMDARRGACSVRGWISCSMSC